MPTYEYRCQDCRQRFNLFITYEAFDSTVVRCEYCNSPNVTRKIGRIRIAKSDESRLESLADPAALDSLEDDPQELGRMMRMMSRELEEDLGPEFDEVVDRLEKGQSPDEIEEALPDLGADEPGMGGLPDLDGL